jgi:hypothetical protein
MNSTSQPKSQDAGHGFPLLSFICAACGSVIGELLSLHLHSLLFEPTLGNAATIWLPAGSALLTLGLAWLLWCLHHHFIRNRTSVQATVYYFCAFLLVLSVGWLIVFLEHLLRHGPFHSSDHPIAFAFILAALLGIFWLFSSVLRSNPEEYLDIQMKPQVGSATDSNQEGQATNQIAIHSDLRNQCRALILFVSTPNIIPQVRGFTQTTAVDSEESYEIDPAPHAMIRDRGGNPKSHPEDKICELSGGAGELENDINKLIASNIYWNWHQQLRALRCMPNIESVYLLGSPDADAYKREIPNAEGQYPEYAPGFRQKPGSGKGSYDYLKLCQAFLKPYLTAGTATRTPVIIRWSPPVDFENFNDITRELRTIISRLSKKQGLKPNEIIVDVTGGQKVVSIAGAVLTVNNELRFQYVQTNEPFATVPYDLVRQDPPSTEPHIHC